MSQGSIYLLPGELTFVIEPTDISTLLGSCVAVCLYDSVTRRGGMNHYLLPHTTERAREPWGRYGDWAIRTLIDRAVQSGCSRHDLVASVYGGGHVLGDASATTRTMDMGTRNLETAFNLLSQLGIPILHSDIGGVSGRKIFMNSATNEILCRPIPIAMRNAGARA